MKCLNFKPQFYSSRQISHILSIRSRTTTFRKFYSNNSTFFWNFLPPHLKIMHNFGNFKRQAYSHPLISFTCSIPWTIPFIKTFCRTLLLLFTAFIKIIIYWWISQYYIDIFIIYSFILVVVYPFVGCRTNLATFGSLSSYPVMFNKTRNYYNLTQYFVHTR